MTQHIQPLTFRAAGVTFRPGYPGTLWELRDLGDAHVAEVLRASGGEFGDEDDEFRRGIEVHMVRDPESPHDPNAIELHVPALGRRGFVGFVPKELAAKLAPKIDGGASFEAVATGVYIDPEHEDKPGVEIAARPIAGDPS